MEDFISQTIDPGLFQIEDVLNDNACFYRAVANGFNLISRNHTGQQIVKESSFDTSKSVNEIYKNHQWGFEGDEQESLARDLQGLAYQWVKVNPKKKVSLSGSEDSDLQMSVEDLVCLTHEMSFSDYIETYKYFAGDIIITTDSDDNSDDNSGSDDTVNILNERWGGYIEQVAISNRFGVAIIVLAPQRYDVKRDKIYNGTIYRNKPYKGVRYRISQIVGKDFLRSGNLPIYLLWKKTVNGPHYLSIYPKDCESCKQLMIESM